MSKRRFTGGSTRRPRPPGAAKGLFKLVGPKLREAKRLPNARGWAKPGRDGRRTKPPRANRPHGALDDAGRQRIADRRQSLSRTHQRDFGMFSRDPDHSRRIKPKAMEEARTALDMREQGMLPADVRRPDRRGQGDFVGTVDGREVFYDIKQWDDKFLGRPGGYTPEDFRAKIQQQVDIDRVVIVDTRTVGQSTIDDMLRVITKNGWSDRVIWYP